MLTCAGEPTAPGETSSDAALATWIVHLRSAGADCRTKLSAVRGIVASR